MTPKFTSGGRSVDQLLRLAAETQQPDVADIVMPTPRAGNELGRLPVVLEPAPSPLGVRYMEQRWPRYVPMEPPQ